MRYERATAISDRHMLLLDLIRDGDLSSRFLQLCFHVQRQRLCGCQLFNCVRFLAEKLGVSEPTINRDIEFLRSQGYEIKAVRIDQRWAYRIIESMVVREQGARLNREGTR